MSTFDSLVAIHVNRRAVTSMTCTGSIIGLNLKAATMGHNTPTNRAGAPRQFALPKLALGPIVIIVSNKSNASGVALYRQR
jgi:hypothetical protein